MRSRLALCLLLTALAAPAAAQVNVEKQRDLDVDGVGLSFHGDFALRAGNSDLYELGLGSQLSGRRGRHFAFLLGNLRYGENNGTTFRNHAFVHLRYNFRLVNWLVGEAFGQIERDGFTLLQLRLLGGAGLRFRHWHGARFGLFQGTSLMAEHENLDGGRVVQHPEVVEVLRWTNYLNLRLDLSDTVTLNHTLYLQPNLADFGDFRVLDEATLALGITDHVAFRTTFNLRYDSEPPDDIEALDVAVRNGLVVTF